MRPELPDPRGKLPGGRRDHTEPGDDRLRDGDQFYHRPRVARRTGPRSSSRHHLRHSPKCGPSTCPHRDGEQSFRTGNRPCHHPGALPGTGRRFLGIPDERREPADCGLHRPIDRRGRQLELGLRRWRNLFTAESFAYLHHTWQLHRAPSGVRARRQRSGNLFRLRNRDRSADSRSADRRLLSDAGQWQSPADGDLHRRFDGRDRRLDLDLRRRGNLLGAEPIAHLHRSGHLHRAPGGGRSRR